MASGEEGGSGQIACSARPAQVSRRVSRRPSARALHTVLACRSMYSDHHRCIVVRLLKLLKPNTTSIWELYRLRKHDVAGRPASGDDLGQRADTLAGVESSRGCGAAGRGGAGEDGRPMGVACRPSSGRHSNLSHCALCGSAWCAQCSAVLRTHAAPRHSTRPFWSVPPCRPPGLARSPPAARRGALAGTMAGTSTPPRQSQTPSVSVSLRVQAASAGCGAARRWRYPMWSTRSSLTGAARR